MSISALKEAEGRMPTQREKVLNLLREAGNVGVTNIELTRKTSHKFNARLQELYVQGYVINKELVGEGVYNYKLISEPEFASEYKKPKKAMDMLMDKINGIGGVVDAEELALMIDNLGFNVVRKAGALK